MEHKNIAWGARGREFESRRPDHINQWVSSHKGLTHLAFWGLSMFLPPRLPPQMVAVAVFS